MITLKVFKSALEKERERERTTRVYINAINGRCFAAAIAFLALAAIETISTMTVYCN